jgi:hypothetical protein
MRWGLFVAVAAIGLGACWASFPDDPEAEQDGQIGDGASGPQACTDRDGDGTSPCQGDCDDSQAAVHPQQRDFFAWPATSGSFDYDCDGQQELERPEPLACDNGCKGNGWLGAVPGCAESGTWARCRKRTGKEGKDDDDDSPRCEVEPLGVEVQRCR